MQRSETKGFSGERGIVLISSLLLLLVVTIMALSIFRGYGTQERIAGNMRDKQRALQAAESAQLFAEWWLATQSNAPLAVGYGMATSADVNCAGVLDANSGQGQICLLPLTAVYGITSAAQWPSLAGGLGVQYTPPGFNYTGNSTNAAVKDVYAARPLFYISDMGTLASGRGEVYQVDALSYGVNQATVAVVESTVQITCVVCNVGGL